MKPLLITDCDEVLLHMWRHFGEWLDETHAIDLEPHDGELASRLRRRHDGEVLEQEAAWELLDTGFLPAELSRQTLAPHVLEALTAIGREADIVILTNLPHDYRTQRITQLEGHGILHRVECNQGGKGEPVARIRAEFGNPVTVFVDDRSAHHQSVAEHAPAVHRLHMVIEPAIAPFIPPAPDAHARIDDWRMAQRWIADRFAAGAHAG